MKNKNAAFIVLAIAMLQVISCAHWQKNKDLTVYIRQERENLSRSSVLVFNFLEPAYAEGMGAKVAEVFHLNLLGAQKFKIASLESHSNWNRITETEESRLLSAIEEGKSKNFDYILVGELVDFYHGGINPTRVKLKVRLIEARTRVTVFLAECSKQSQAKDPSFPMNTQLSNQAETPMKLAASIAKMMIEKL